MSALVLLLTLGVISAACADSLATNNPTVTTYWVRGVFQEARSGGRAAVIAHEAIPGYMEAMTMPFNVKQSEELRLLQSGDEITFRLSVTDTDDWIDQIRKMGRTRGVRADTSSSGGAPRLADGQVPVLADSLGDVGAGELVPDCVLTNQSGRILRLRNFSGQAVAFTFFFSRCPLPTFCPRLNQNFSSVQQALAGDGTRTNWQLLTISFDPGFDTQQQLADVARRHDVDPSHWNFATSSMAEVRRLGTCFGLQFWRENGTFSHNLRTVVVDADGRVQRVFRGNEWKTAELVGEMRKAMKAGGR